MGDWCALNCETGPCPQTSRPSTGLGLTDHTPETDVTHPGVDHLRPPGGRPVAHAITVRTKI
jgi:hypothetical protein